MSADRYDMMHEDELRTELRAAHETHKKQLTAERERVKKLADEWWGMALDAEREKHKEELKKLEHFHQAELLKLEAAIAKAIRKLRHETPSFVAQEIANDLDEVDLSALDRYVAEKTKPLVDLLTRLQPYQTPDDAKIIADALANLAKP